MHPKTYAISVDDVASSITCNTIMLYSSAPSFPQGVIDPIVRLGRCNLGLIVYINKLYIVHNINPHATSNPNYRKYGQLLWYWSSC